MGNKIKYTSQTQRIIDVFGGVKSKAHKGKKGMAKAVAAAEKKLEDKKPKSAAVKAGWPGNKNY